MKFGLTSIFIFILFLSHAQLTPQPSPGASISQTIGVTELYLEFSRPSVKGRKVFGELVPFQKVWRTGANASTKIEIPNEIQIEGKTIFPGIYAIMTRPGIKTWEVYLLEDLEVSEETFINTFPLYSLQVPSKKIPFTETFTIFFSDITDEASKLHFQWETTEIILSVKVNNILPVTEAIAVKSNEMAGNLQQAAEYLLQKNQNLELALSYIEKSIVLSETFRNNWIKAQIEYSLEEYKLALSSASRAKDLGEGNPVYEFFSITIDATILDLKTKTL
jgi:hypothetical protein